MNMLRVGLAVVATLIFAISCKSIAEEDHFLVDKLTDKAKAQALVDVGVDSYNLYLKGKDQKLDRYNEVKQYFVVANRFDPLNKDAKNYLKVLEDFKAQEFQSSLNSAQKLYAGKNRSPDDEFSMVVAIHKALLLDPDSVEAKKLDQDTKQIQEKFATQNLGKADAAFQKIKPESKDEVREAAFLEAYSYTQRALLVMPDNSEAKGKRGQYLEELSRILHNRLEAIDRLIANGSYSQAENQVGIADALNQKIGNPVKPEIDQLRYNIYVKWAQLSAERKDWINAQARIQAALYYKRTPEAIELDRTIGAQVNQGPGFDVVLASIDASIGKNDLVGATTKISVALKNAKDKTQLSALNERQNGINDKIPDYYTKGVQAYRNEDFKAAIESLQVVVGVIPSYLDASDYLRKAREKQKVLE